MTAALPAMCLELTEVIGATATIKLMQGLGGISLPIPKSKNSKMWAAIAAAAGEEAADAIVQRYADTRLYIPRGAEAVRVARNTQIRADYDAACGGVKEEERCNPDELGIVDQLAIKHQLSARQIRSILNEPTEPAVAQPSLF